MEISMELRSMKLVLLCCIASILSACGGQESGTVTPSVSSTRLSVAQALFAEKALSANGQMACASCHTDESAHADAVGTHLPLGGLSMTVQGFRSSPTLLYLEANQPFRFDGGKAFGGFTWDGRASSRAEQAAGPLLDPSEMANVNAAAVADKVRQLPYFKDFVSVFGLPSKFDRYLDGNATLTVEEARGLRLFNDANKGNCASCHSSQTGTQGERPLFTHFGYAAHGLPRNAQIQANADPAFFDMGLCGPKRTDLSARTDLCGLFKVPTLRNIELTAPYFHNASVTTLAQAVSFYATRDLRPDLWYPTVNGQVQKFNDLPASLRTNVSMVRPFGLRPGDAPILTAEDVADLVAFLRTLTDDRTAPSGSTLVKRKN
jgi:cytochrome c peroxidase